MSDDWIPKTTASLVQQFYPFEYGVHALADFQAGGCEPNWHLKLSTVVDMFSVLLSHGFKFGRGLSYTSFPLLNISIGNERQCF